MSATVGQLSLAHVIYKCNSRSVMSATAGHILWHYYAADYFGIRLFEDKDFFSGKL